MCTKKWERDIEIFSRIKPRKESTGIDKTKYNDFMYTCLSYLNLIIRIYKFFVKNIPITQIPVTWD